jgi:hypothetical protein
MQAESDCLSIDLALDNTQYRIIGNWVASTSARQAIRFTLLRAKRVLSRAIGFPMSVSMSFKTLSTIAISQEMVDMIRDIGPLENATSGSYRIDESPEYGVTRIPNRLYGIPIVVDDGIEPGKVIVSCEPPDSPQFVIRNAC